MKKINWYWLIGGLAVAGIIAYFVFFRKKSKLSKKEIDRLKAVFKTTNPFKDDRVLKADYISPVGEQDMTPAPDSTRTSKVKLSSRDEFEKQVLNQIRFILEDPEQGYVKSIMNDKTKFWSWGARAGYNNSLEQAIAYKIRFDNAMDKYYVDNTTPKDASGNPTTTPPVLWENEEQV